MNQVTSRSHMGRGTITLQENEGKTYVVQAFGHDPLRLFLPRARATRSAARITLSGYGGGLVAGDEIDLNIHLGAQAKGIFTTLAATKVFKNPEQLPCAQRVNAQIEEGGILIMAPHPTMCFSEARYDQHQHFDLQPGAGLVVIDWLLSGRWSSGERWRFSHYSSRLTVSQNEEPLLHESLLLEGGHAHLTRPYNCGRFNSIAVVALIGEPLQSVCDQLLHEEELRRHGPSPARQADSLITSTSPITGGILIRILSEDSERTEAHLRSILSHVATLIGEPIWYTNAAW